MEARLDVMSQPTTGKLVKHLMSAGKILQESGLPQSTQELVALRISQINGCAVCVDIHTRNAVQAGEKSERLHMVAVWREATIFTEAERAALRLAEEGTRIADGAPGVTDETWAQAAEHYDEDQLAALVALVALMNTVNRLNAITRRPAGGHRPEPVPSSV
ncbi:carboxymuconolactone decarboxylase family protein [Nonomuraea sp. NPDC004580]|uniref:carboxymuconolactone decarboxylase family protein n=1 Tax=Nonomuraea sp. NPDC004580 TaxID=3154552 RepID=UPI0033AF1A9C